jgi:hypothetical protein
MRSHLWVSKGSGPLAGYAEGYGQWVEARGYSPRVVSQKVWQLSQLSCWLEREGLAVEEWTAEMTARFAAGLQAAGYRSYLWRGEFAGAACVSAGARCDAGAVTGGGTG